MESLNIIVYALNEYVAELREIKEESNNEE